jgi:hypothetical protein
MARFWVIKNGQFWVIENGQLRFLYDSDIKCVTGNEILQKEITGTQIRFSTKFGGKPSFIPLSSFLSASNAATYIFHCSYLYNYYN